VKSWRHHSGVFFILPAGIESGLKMEVEADGPEADCFVTRCRFFAGCVNTKIS
jgi:hypothetical protein